MVTFMVQVQQTYKEREKRRREHEIVLEARRLIHEQGAASFNMDALAEAVGVSKPTLYQHFKSKDDLIVRVLAEVITEMGDRLAAMREGSPLERLKNTLQGVLIQRYTVEKFRIDFEWDMTILPLRSRPEVLAAKNQTMAVVSAVVNEGKASGEITTTIPTPVIGCLLFRLLGLPATIKLYGSLETGIPDASEPFTAATFTPILNHVIEIFERSVAQTKPVS
jgi:AcrR family transcriptional regulator